MAQSKFSFLLEQLHCLAVIASPYLVILLYLLTVNRIFLHLLVQKNYGLGKRKFIYKILEDLFGNEFIKCVINEWKTCRNTVRNSVKIAPPMLEKGIARKNTIKVVQFDC